MTCFNKHLLDNNARRNINPRVLLIPSVRRRIRKNGMIGNILKRDTRCHYLTKNRIRRKKHHVRMRPRMVAYRMPALNQLLCTCREERIPAVFRAVFFEFTSAKIESSFSTCTFKHSRLREMLWTGIVPPCAERTLRASGQRKQRYCRRRRFVRRGESDRHLLFVFRKRKRIGACLNKEDPGTRSECETVKSVKMSFLSHRSSLVQKFNVGQLFRIRKLLRAIAGNTSAAGLDMKSPVKFTG